MSGDGGHRVPEKAREQTAATLRATANLVGRPTDAERSRTLLAAHAFGSLATMSTQCPGFPFGSLVGYVVDDLGRPLLCLSSLAEHSRNIAVNPASSLLVTEHDGGEDSLAQGRVTLVGEMARLEGEEREAGLDRYVAGHPTAFYASFHDFAVYRLAVADVRYVGGFGRMSWVGAQEFASAEPDPLLPAAERILTHMNDDHADALVAYCRAFADLQPASARMTGVDRYGMDVLAVLADGTEHAVRVPFDQPTDSVDAVRRQTVALLHQARAQVAASS